jgi:ABC-2 type transport system permease protein
MADSLAVARRGWVDRRRSRLGWAIGLALYMAMMLAVWPSLEGSDSFADVAQDYPEALKAMFGGAEAFDAITTPEGFLNSYVFSFMLPLLLVMMAIGLGAALIGEEDEEGLMDLLLSNPVSRRRVVLEKALVVAGQVLLLTLVVLVVIVAGGPAVGLDIAASGLVAAGIGSLLYGLLGGLVALLAGAASGRRAPALAIGAVVTVAGYLLTTIAELASWAEPLGKASPLHHATAGNPVQNGMPANYLILAGAAVVVLVATVVVFDRKDLT